MFSTPQEGQLFSWGAPSGGLVKFQDVLLNIMKMPCLGLVNYTLKEKIQQID